MIKFGIVGGAIGSFAGEAHRISAELDLECSLVAGCFSRDYDKTLETGKKYGIDKDRLYHSYKEMAEKESAREDGIDFIAVVTPNYLHYEMAKEFLLHGINVACDKPLTVELHEAQELEQLAREKNLLFCVTYSYTGYPMIKQVREMIKNGDIGEVKYVAGEFTTDWLIKAMVNNDSQLGLWRLDPKLSGKSNCVADIGSHLENMIGYVTGLEIDTLLARMDKIGEGMVLDNNANILVNYTSGAVGSYWVSQITSGTDHGLNFRIFGTEGSIEWHQYKPEYLRVARADQPVQTFTRGNSYLYPESKNLSRIASGHPEGYFLAFANLYTAFIDALQRKKDGEDISGMSFDYPDISKGVHSVRFTEKCLESAENGSIWVSFKD